MATNFIESIKNTVLSFFNKKGDVTVVTGIDIGGSSIKLVEMSIRGGKTVLNTYGSIALGPYAGKPVGMVVSVTPENIGKALIELFKETNATQTNVAVTIPTSASLLHDIAIPIGINDSEIKTVVMTEAHRVIPVPVSDVEIDWLSIPEEILPKEILDQNKKHFLLVAVSHESQKRTESYMKNAQITPSVYELEVFSSMRSIYTHERSAIVLIDLGAAHIKVSIIHEGIMRRAVSLDNGFNELDLALVKTGISFEQARKTKYASSIIGHTNEEKIFQMCQLLTLSDSFDVLLM